MNTVHRNGANLRRTVIAATVASVLLTACAAAPLKPDGADEVRSKLTQLQADPNLASRAPLAFKEAEAAVRTAEQPQPDQELAAHRVYLADRKVETARAQAETRLAEDQRAALSTQRESARLDARTREADVANRQAATARAEGAEQKLAADQARSESDAARVAAGNSEQQAAELQRQVDVLQAKVTDRGLVLTLHDVLFESGRAELKKGSAANLNRLVTFLNDHTDRSVAIEGYTDSVGSQEYNQALSQRRADAVRSYLMTQDISPARLTASGMGESDPVAGNESATGRQQNRRVEVIISNPAAALR